MLFELLAFLDSLTGTGCFKTINNILLQKVARLTPLTRSSQVILRTHKDIPNLGLK